jgi:hypothetical protein
VTNWQIWERRRADIAATLKRIRQAINLKV